jgi:hypothetical protein
VIDTYVNRSLCVGLLNNSDSGIGDEDEENDEGFHKCAKDATLVLLKQREYERDERRAKEDEHELIFELFEDELPQRRRWVLREF